MAARLPRRRSLDTRLAVSVALSVAAVLSVVTVTAITIANWQVDADIRDTARVTAIALADDIELRDQPVTRDVLVPLLRDFMNAATDLDSIDVFRLENGVPTLVATTSAIDRPPTELVQRAIKSGQTTWSGGSSTLATVAVPIYTGDRITGAVSVATGALPGVGCLLYSQF